MTEAVLSIEVEECEGNTAIVHCHGRLIAGATDVLYSGVKALIPGRRRIVLDLSDLKHTDSMGLGTLVRLYMAAKSAGCSLELINLGQQIRNLLGLVQLLDVFTVAGENNVRFM